jgi:hypothetical protein
LGVPALRKRIGRAQPPSDSALQMVRRTVIPASEEPGLRFYRSSCMQQLFHFALVSPSWPLWLRYSLTVLLVLVSLGIRLTLDDMSGYPFLLFFPAIIVSGIVFNTHSSVAI